MGTGGIYEIVNTVNGKRYIGSAVDLARRWKGHRRDLVCGDHHSVVLQRAWNKYGGQAFLFMPLMLCIGTDLREWENRYIQEFKPEYNVAKDALAPMQGRKHTSEVKKKISEASLGNTYAKGYRWSSEACAEMSAARKKNPPNLGNKHTPGAKKKISEARKGKPTTLGYKHTPESCAKMSKSRKGNTNALGHTLSPESCAEISRALKGNKNAVGNKNALGLKRSPETKAKMSAAAVLRWAKVRAAKVQAQEAQLCS